MPNDVDAKPMHTTIEPEVHDLMHGGLEFRMPLIQIGLLLKVGMV